MLRSKSRVSKRTKMRKGYRSELPSNVATKEIPPYPPFPPESWVWELLGFIFVLTKS